MPCWVISASTGNHYSTKFNFSASQFKNPMYSFLLPWGYIYVNLFKFIFLKPQLHILFIPIKDSKMAGSLSFIFRKPRDAFYFICLLIDFHHVNISNKSFLAGQN